jgi:hypothetical protein
MFALIVYPVWVLGFTLTFCAQCMHNALCKNGAKQRVSYTFCTYILRICALCKAMHG